MKDENLENRSDVGASLIGDVLGKKDPLFGLYGVPDEAEKYVVDYRED